MPRVLTWSHTAKNSPSRAIPTPLSVKACLNIRPGRNCVKVVTRLDNTRIWKADKAIEDTEKKCRRELTSAKRKLEDHYEQQEDPDNPAYGAGMH
ncbi:hypothetical protein J6590_032523 [Homalodisca vitripennis]|nr:hypothetical protein J6590_032523 [Homalodisca vitripennis]